MPGAQVPRASHHLVHNEAAGGCGTGACPDGCTDAVHRWLGEGRPFDQVMGAWHQERGDAKDIPIYVPTAPAFGLGSALHNRRMDSASSGPARA